MGELAEFYKDLKDHYKAKREYNLATSNPDGWTQHNEYHWSQSLNGSRLDYWPSRNKFMFCGKVMTGDVQQFISKHRKKKHDKPNTST